MVPLIGLNEVEEKNMYSLFTEIVTLADGVINSLLALSSLPPGIKAAAQAFVNAGAALIEAIKAGV